MRLVHGGKQVVTSKDFLCSDCGKSFYWKKSLEKHVEIVHLGVKSFVCPVCQKSFGHKQTLDRHVKCIHETLKEFSCSICEKNFATKSSLDNHVKVLHQGQVSQLLEGRLRRLRYLSGCTRALL